MKTIGLIGGMSWESSAEYYRLINQGMKTRLGGHRNARSIMSTVCFEDIKTLQHENRWDDLSLIMQQAAMQVQAGGADFVVLCTNTMHKLSSAIESVLDIPFLHIVDPTAEAILKAGFNRVALLGTSFTMEQDFYRKRMEGKHGLSVLVPEAADRTVVHNIIYNELCHGVIKQESKKSYQQIINKLYNDGAQAVILGCTEIALLIKPEDSSIPVFDTTELHALAAVDMAIA